MNKTQNKTNEIQEKIQKEKDIIWDALRQKDEQGAYIVVYDYLTASYGENLAVYPDGSYAIGQDVGNEIDPDDRPLACIDCPGLSCLDTRPFSEGWAIDNKDGTYTVEDTGEEIDLGELIYRCCRDGDVEDYIVEIQNEMYAQVEEASLQEKEGRQK